MITLNARLFTRKIGIESWCCESVGMKNVGRCQAHQVCAENEGGGERAPALEQTRQGETAPPELLAQRAGIGDQREGQKGEKPGPCGKAREEVGIQEPGGDQIQCGKTDEDSDVPRHSGPARNDACEQAADTCPTVGACCHDEAGDGRAEGGHVVQRV